MATRTLVVYVDLMNEQVSSGVGEHSFKRKHKNEKISNQNSGDEENLSSRQKKSQKIAKNRSSVLGLGVHLAYSKVWRNPRVHLAYFRKVAESQVFKNSIQNTYSSGVTTLRCGEAGDPRSHAI